MYKGRGTVESVEGEVKFAYFSWVCDNCEEEWFVVNIGLPPGWIKEEDKHLCPRCHEEDIDLSGYGAQKITMQGADKENEGEVRIVYIITPIESTEGQD